MIDCAHLRGTHILVVHNQMRCGLVRALSRGGRDLGVRGSAHLRAGGFPPLVVSADHGLVGAVLLGGRTVLRTPASPVRTSSRRAARSRGGLGTDLQRLAARFDGS